MLHFVNSGFGFVSAGTQKREAWFQASPRDPLEDMTV